jgi:dipeptidyl aminopeptidase/acylaminoacyl peptidase
VAFAPDGKRVVVGTLWGEARVWETATGAAVSPPMQGTPGVSLVQVGFVPGGGKVFTVGNDRRFVAWDPASGQPVGAPSLSDPEIMTARADAGGRAVVLATLSGGVRVRRIADGGMEWPVLRHAGFVFFADLAPDARWVVTGTQNGLVQSWRAPENGSRAAMGGAGALVAAEYSPDGSRVMTASTDGAVRIWNPDAAADAKSPEPEAAATFPGVRFARFAPDGRRVAVGGDDGRVRLWNPTTGKQDGPPMEHDAPVRRADFSPDGTRLATITLPGVAAAGAARVWDTATGLPATPPIPHARRIYWCEFSPDGTRLLTSCADGFVRVWDARTGAAAAPPMHVGGYAWEAHFSVDGRRVVAANTDDGYSPCAAKLFDAGTGVLLRNWTGHRDGVLMAAFAPDGRHAATGSEDDTVLVWDADHDGPVTPAMWHTGKITRLAFSPDGRLLATASLDGTARVWETASGVAVTPPLAHAKGAVRMVMFRRDGRQLLTGGDDGQARLWDLRPAGGSPESIARRARRLASGELDASGNYVPLDRARLLEAMGTDH